MCHARALRLLQEYVLSKGLMNTAASRPPASLSHRGDNLESPEDRSLA
jgi:hypothetical protein